MNIETQLQRLQSRNQQEAEDALNYFSDLFYFDKPISGEDYLLAIKTLVEMVEKNNYFVLESDLLALLESSLYSNGQKIIEPEIFKSAIDIMVKTNNPIFKEILAPLQKTPSLNQLLHIYFENIK